MVSSQSSIRLSKPLLVAKVCRGPVSTHQLGLGRTGARRQVRRRGGLLAGVDVRDDVGSWGSCVVMVGLSLGSHRRTSSTNPGRPPSAACFTTGLVRWPVPATDEIGSSPYSGARCPCRGVDQRRGAFVLSARDVRQDLADARSDLTQGRLSRASRFSTSGPSAVMSPAPMVMMMSPEPASPASTEDASPGSGT